MSKLIRAGFLRYIHSHIFLRALIVTVAIAAFCGFNARQYNLEDFYVTVFLIAIAVLISWLVGREHEEGFRNKVISGHTKGNIFFSEWILGVSFSVVLYLIFAMIFLGMNSYIIGYAKTGVAVKIFLSGLLATACSAAITVTVSCMISRRAMIGIVNILLIFCFVFASETISSMLNRPEYNEEYDYEYTEVVDEKGNTYLEMSVVEGSQRLVENPNYIKSPIRDVLYVICRISPFTSIREGGKITYGWFGYHMQVNGNSTDSSHILWEHLADFSVTKEEMTTLNISLICSFIELVMIGCIGYFLFRKKELK